jgi:hypothetical protein
MSKILAEAMEDARALKETAVEHARNMLVEALQPKIKEFVDSQLGTSAPVEGSMYEKYDEDGQDKELLMQLLAKNLMSKEEILDALPGSEDVFGAPEADVSISDMGLGGEVDHTDGDEDEMDMDMDEVVDITQEDVKTAFSEALNDALKDLKSEATVKAGFGKGEDPNKGEAGLLDKKAGEAAWKDGDAPAAKDWTVKEAAYKAHMKTLAGENSKLKAENTEYRKACDYLKKNLQEVTLFNSKLLYTNKVFQSVDLNNKQRVSVIEQFDNAESMREVELIYKSLSESLKIAGVVNESKVVNGDSARKGPKSSRFTTPSSTLLKEGTDKETVSSEAQRWRDLAGLVD